MPDKPMTEEEQARRFARFVDRWAREKGYTVKHELRKRAKEVLDATAVR